MAFLKYKKLFFILVNLIALHFATKAQDFTTGPLINTITRIDTNKNYTPAQKLERFWLVKNSMEGNKVKYDSAYCILLLKIASLEVNLNTDFQESIHLINAALKVNLANKTSASKYLTAKSYFSLAMNYYALSLYDRSLYYFDSTITIATTFPDTTIFILYAKLYKAFLYNQKGDYQKSVDESTTGINYSITKKDSALYTAFLNQRAQSLFYEHNFDEALRNLETIIVISRNKDQPDELASALKMKAMILEETGSILKADRLFKQAIQYRLQTKLYQSIALDYTDYGNFLLNTIKDYKKAERCYKQAISCGNKINDSVILAKASINLEEVFFNQGKYAIAASYLIKTFKYLNIYKGDGLNQNPTLVQLNSIPDKELALTLMTNKLGLSLKKMSTGKAPEMLQPCIKNALVIDSLISKLRHEQLGTISKLYWRNYTRDFYNAAIEISYKANNAELVLFFMERSRAVLLNDKLNELNASSYLSKADAAKQEAFEIRIIELQQKMSALADTSKKYQALQLQLLNIKNDYEQFIKSLEQKYPVYYQYKYADNVPTLKALQSYLAKNKQNFVHYFFADTATYVLAITANHTQIIKLTQNEFNKDELTCFIKLCADKKALNNNYHSFASLSNSIYKKIFKPLHLPEGRIVICTENTVIPFEALCADRNGKHFLLNDYSFSYAYSAGFLIKQFNNPPATGNFIGFAPVSFNKSLGVVDLKNAANALNTAAAFYNNDKLFTHANASRYNFFNYAPSYSVVSIFSHAYADTTDNEPVLFMQDSLIHLSELQTLNNPATKLVLLSACQTNVGKNATGEGIYSLARGFASAGIPSVSATLWKADEQTIYAISEKFNQYLSQGMAKDKALQKAKLDFIQNNSREKTLPYYWANMILIGNADIIQFSNSHFPVYLWIAGIFILIFLLALIIKKTNFK